MNNNNSKEFDSNARWSTYEANVQAYRSNMIASQSFLLAVGAILLEKNAVLLGVCVVVALFQLWYIWYRVIRTRTIIVDFYKFQLFEKFNLNGAMLSDGEESLSEEEYLKNVQIRRKVNEQLAKDKHKPKLRHNLRLTRVKLDLILPISFSIIWVSLFVASIIISL